MRGKGKVIRLDISYSNPEEEAEKLAVKLAEAYNAVSIFERQAVDFNRQAYDERRKAAEVQVILSSLKEWRNQLERDRNNGIERKISRMEPMLSYDKEALERQLAINKSDAEMHAETANDFTNRAAESRKEILKLQAKIKEANAQKKRQ